MLIDFDAVTVDLRRSVLNLVLGDGIGSRDTNTGGFETGESAS